MGEDDKTLEEGLRSTANALRIKQEFQRVLIDGIGVLPGEHLDQFAERLVRELQSWRTGARRRSLPAIESVPDVTSTAAALARQSWDEEKDHGELMRSAAGTLANLGTAATVLLAERDTLRWLHAEAAFERDTTLANLEAALADKDRVIQRMAVWRDRWMDAWHATHAEWWKSQGEIDRLRREVEFWGNADPLTDGHAGSRDNLRYPLCACISDDQAASLAPGFARPVCAVHPDDPATHPANESFTAHPTHEVYDYQHPAVGTVHWQPGDPVYPDKREDPSGGACSDPTCGVTWAPAGPEVCPSCDAPAVTTPSGTPWAEGGEQ